MRAGRWCGHALYDGDASVTSAWIPGRSSVVLARVAETTTAVSDRIVVSVGGVVDCAPARGDCSAAIAASTANDRTNGWYGFGDIWNSAL